MAIGEGEGIGGDDTGVGFDDDSFGGDFDFSVDDIFGSVGTNPKGPGLDLGSVFDDPTEDIDFDVGDVGTGFDFSFDEVESSLFDSGDFATDFQFESLSFSDDVSLFMKAHPTLTSIGVGILGAVNPALGFAASTARKGLTEFGVSPQDALLSSVADLAINTSVGAVVGPISRSLGSTVGQAVGGGIPGAITAGVVGSGVKSVATRAVKEEIAGLRVRSPGEVGSLLDPEAGPVDIPTVRSPERFKEHFEDRRRRFV
jgi:hypothetical protein